ncbi:MAG: undecaprenyl/decaprenyl-phosphate alpha-N-acetylglucosaminyl 1-phosphate transferase [Proteobacteria bacterium]|nr:undecaprenyl/decaprenyl-phosphate alpha-N-acetylglucosaminyl 1-phosphate transferase [Pseudomonadota bacterium]
MNNIFFFILCAVVSGISIYIAICLMRTLNLVDYSSEQHKLHDINTPFVGGVGVLVALFLAIVVQASIYSEIFEKWLILGLCSLIIFITGFIDDTVKLSYKLRFIIQFIVALIMSVVGDLVFTNLGGVLWGESLILSEWVAIVFTIIFITGGINAINMIDGIDGLSGSISLTTLSLIGIVTFVAKDQHNFMLTIALAGGVVGFLYHNLRYASKRYARVFLGDNGSTLLGFILGWLLIDLSQGKNPAMTPVTAIWLFSIPLLDTVSIMLRRIWLGQSPFKADRYHLHHMFQKAGFFVTEITYSITLLHLLFGVIGLTGLYFDISEYVMLLGFLLVFMGYLYLTLNPWKFISMLRNLRVLIWNIRLGFARPASCGVFLNSYSTIECENMVKMVNEELEHNTNFSIRIFKQSSPPGSRCNHFSITLNIWLAKDDCVSEEMVEQKIIPLEERLKERCGILLRRLRARDKDFDLRAYSSGHAFGESLVVSRRGLGPQALIFEVIRQV